MKTTNSTSNVKVPVAPVMTRRQALAVSAAGLATAITVLSVKPAPAAAKRPEISPELKALIATHKKAWKHWDSVATTLDELKIGREPTAKEVKVWEDGSDGEYDALTAICRFPARTPADLAAKGRHLKKFHSWEQGELQQEQVTAILRSMIDAGKAVRS